MDNKFNLGGNTALITGCAGLLGGQHAAAILENEGSVILTDIDYSGLIEQKKILERTWGFTSSHL